MDRAIDQVLAEWRREFNQAAGPSEADLQAYLAGTLPAGRTDEVRRQIFGSAAAVRRLLELAPPEPEDEDEESDAPILVFPIERLRGYAPTAALGLAAAGPAEEPEGLETHSESTLVAQLSLAPDGGLTVAVEQARRPVAGAMVSLRRVVVGTGSTRLSGGLTDKDGLITLPKPPDPAGAGCYVVIVSPPDEPGAP